MGETWRTDRQTDRQVTIATVWMHDTDFTTDFKSTRNTFKNTKEGFQHRWTLMTEDPGVHKVSGSRRIPKFDLRRLYLHPRHAVEIKHSLQMG